MSAEKQQLLSAAERRNTEVFTDGNPNAKGGRKKESIM